MYINNTTVTVNFVLAPSALPPAQSTYDLLVKTPAGVVTYTDSGLLTYVAPTATAQGSATYAHLLNEEGRWEFSLTSGTDACFTVISKILLYSMTPVVFGSTQTVNKQALVANFVIPTIPLAPSVLAAAVVSDTAIDLTWTDNSDDEDNFVLERSLTTGTGFSVINSPAANAVAYSDTGLTPGTEYFYRIKATNAVGDSAYTAEDSAITPSVPDAPTILVATAVSSTAIDLTWQDNSDDELNFVLERSVTSGSGFATINSPAADAVAYSDTGLSVLTTYYYRIKATNAIGDSTYSNEATDITFDVAPAAPSTLVATQVSDVAIDLTWVDNSTNELNFVLERSLTTGTGFSVISSPVANAVAFSDTGLTGSTEYFYRIKATNAIGDSSYSAEDSATTAVSATVPTAPSSLVATMVSATEIDLTWTDNSSGAGQELNFVLERSLTTGTGFSVINSPIADAVAYSDTGLTASTEYFYRIKATNTAGDSAYSAEDSATTDIGSSAYETAILADSPVGYWKLDETAGTTAVDEISANNLTYANGYTLNQTSLINSGVSVAFDGGASSRARLSPAPAALIILGDLTMEAWVKLDALTSDFQYIMGNIGIVSDASDTTNWTYSLGVTSTGQLRVFWETAVGTNVEVISGFTLELATTYHVAVVRNSTNKTVTFYINGLEYDTRSYTSNPTSGTSTFFIIGCDEDGPLGWDGNIDEVAVYNKILTDVEIAAHTIAAGATFDTRASYQAQITTDSPVGHWKMDDASGTTLVDAISANNLTTTNVTEGNAPLVASSTAAALFSSSSGSNGAVSSGSPAALQITGDLTMECWVNLTSVVANKNLMHWGDIGETLATNLLYDFRVNGSSKLEAFHEYGSGSNQQVSSSHTVTTGLHHFVCTRDATANKYYFYDNGVLVDTVSYTNDPAGGTTGEMHIGRNSTTAFNYAIAATFDQVAVYNTRLTNKQILNHYLAGTSVAVPSDVFWENTLLLLPMIGSDEGTTFTDESDYVNVFTPSGTVKTDDAVTDPFGASLTSYLGASSSDIAAPYVTGEHNWDNGDFTVEAWVYAPSWTTWANAGGAPNMIGNMTSNTTTQYWGFGPNASGNLMFYYYNGTTNSVTGTTALATSTWIHVAMTHRASDSRIDLYINGALEANAIVSGTPQNVAQNLRIGQADSSALDGRISDLRMTASNRYNSTVFTAPTERFPWIPPSNIGLEDGTLADGSITATTYFDYLGNYIPSNGRLHFANAWAPSAAVTGDAIKFDIGSIKSVIGISIMGGVITTTQWITGFSIDYSDDDITYTPYNSGEVLPGNTAATPQVVINALTSFDARYVRVTVETINGWGQGRFEIYIDE